MWGVCCLVQWLISERESKTFPPSNRFNRVRQRTVRVIFQLSFYYLNWVLPCIVTAATCCRCCAIKFPNIKFNLPPFMTHSFWECFFLLLLLRYSWGSLCGRAKTRLYFMRCRFRNGKWASYATRAGIFRRNKYAIRDSMRMKKNRIKALPCSAKYIQKKSFERSVSRRKQIKFWNWDQALSIGWVTLKVIYVVLIIYEVFDSNLRLNFSERECYVIYEQRLTPKNNTRSCFFASQT